VYQTDGDSAFDEIGKDFQQGHEAAAFRHVQVLDVGGDDPEKLLRLREKLQNHPAVDGLVQQEFHGLGFQKVRRNATNLLQEPQYTSRR
jgi:hypothetical protein